LADTVTASIPEGYSLFLNNSLGISFVYPEAWVLEVSCGSPDALVSPGSCNVVLTPPFLDPPDAKCVPDEPPRTTRVSIGAQPTDVRLDEVCTAHLAGSPLFGSIYHLGQRVYTSCGYAGFGDGAEACVTDGRGKRAIIQMAPASGKEDLQLNVIVQSFRFVN